MVFYTLDAIVRNTLVKRNYPLHFYMQFLVYGASGLRELYLDDIKIVNTKLIPVDSNTNEAQLPNDYVDYVEIGYELGQIIAPLVEAEALNPLPKYTSNFTQTEYVQPNQNDGNIFYYNYTLPLFWNTVTWNDFGENIGRLYGWGNGNAPDTFTIVKERNVVMVNDELSIGNIVLKYISDGQSADAISQIPAEAYDTLYKYITWQHKENIRSYSEGEKQRAKQEYLIARDILRARMNGLTPEIVIRLFQKNYMGAARS